MRLPADPQRDLAATLREPAERRIHVLGRQAADDLVHAHPERRQARRVEIDRDFALRRPDQLGLGHAGDALQAALDLPVRQRRQLPRRQRLRLDREREDRHRVEVELLDDRFLHPLGQLAPHRVDLGPRLLRDVVDLHLEVELDDDRREPFARDRVDVLHARDRVHRLLDLLAHLALDRLGRRARVLGDDRQHGNLDVRHHVDRQAPEREDAERHQREDHHGGDHRPLD